jgi:LacI family transcriptional regulator
MERGGYRVNHAARTLRTSRTTLVGLLVPAINHEVFGAIAERLEETLRPRGIAVTITSSGWDPANDVLGLDALESRSVDALVVSLADDRTPAIARRLRAVTCPLVLVDRDVRGIRADAVVMQYRPGVDAALAHLTDLGHRRIALLTVTLRTRAGREITRAFRARLEALGLDSSQDVVFECTRHDEAGGADIAARALAAGFTAIVVAVPMIVLAGLLEYLRASRVSVPRDVSVVVYSDNPLARTTAPRLAVIGRPVDDLGRLAGRLVLDRLATPDRPRRIETIVTDFDARQSTAPPPASARA